MGAGYVDPFLIFMGGGWVWIIFDVIICCRIWANLQVIVFVMRCNSRLFRVGLGRREKWDG